MQVALLTAQYTTLFLATTTLHSQSIECRKYDRPRGGFKSAGRGWDKGVCMTEEQVWCRAHPGKHADCALADCRAEEVRLSLWRASTGTGTKPDPNPVYAGCSSSDFLELYEHIEQMNQPWRPWADFGKCAVCVPASDGRSLYLPLCDEVQARCHGKFFRPPDDSSIVSWDCGADPINYNVVRQRSASPYWACPLQNPLP